MSKIAVATDVTQAENNRGQSAYLANDIRERRSQELIFALVGPLGSGCTTTATELRKILENEFKYTLPPTITVSNFIREALGKSGATPPIRKDGLDEYITAMQNAGNQLREKYGNTYLVEKAIESIHSSRRRLGGFDGDHIIPKRIAYIIDSIKNLDEVDLLRRVYGESLVVIGVFAPDSIRNKRLNIKESRKQSFLEIFRRDQGEEASFGQKTRKVFVLADYFLCNDAGLDHLREKIRRFVELLFDIGIHTPTRDESAMYLANSSAANSACMSRQVGAAIMSDDGELLGVGWNDVPKFGGGLYSEDDRISSGKDNRCYDWADGECHNEVRRMAILTDIVQKIHGAGLLKRGKGQDDIREAISGTGIENLIEFSRSVHAEMEAIMSVAREGKHSLVASTLYTNTYPCHNCARHIVAAGMKRVVYIEPYLKSLAMKLHSDAITETPIDLDEYRKKGVRPKRQAKVFFQQFDGVAPRNYLKLFRPVDERKESGKRREVDPKTAVPILSIPLDGPASYESKVVADLAEKEGGVA